MVTEFLIVAQQYRSAARYGYYQILIAVGVDVSVRGTAAD
jgi:hypothetical protein